MKKFLSGSILIIFCLFLFSTCSNPVEIKNTKNGSGPTIIYDNSKPLESIISYQAKVKVLRMDTRRISGVKAESAYKLSVKKINGQINMRIDYPPKPEFNAPARSLVFSGKNVVAFDTASGQVISRATWSADDGNTDNIMGKIGVKKIIQQYRQAAFDVVEDKTNPDLIAVHIPPVKIAADISEPVPESVILYFDQKMDVFSGSESITIKQDGTKVVLKDSNFYKEVSGQPVLIGRMSAVHYAFPKKLDTSDRDIPPLDPASAREITQAELKKLLKEKNAQILDSNIIGDAGKLDNTVVTFKLYEDITLNSLQDEYFKKGMEK